MHLTNGNITVVPEESQVFINGVLTSMPKKELRLLTYFMCNVGRLQKYDDIIVPMWGIAYKGTESGRHYLRISLGLLKKVIGRDVIINVTGVGYRMKALEEQVIKCPNCLILEEKIQQLQKGN